MKLKSNAQNQIMGLSLAHFIIVLLLLQYCSATTNLSNQTDRLALLDFKHQIAEDPNEFFNSWNDSQHFCQWRGITCGSRHQRVVGLNVSFQNILGTISPHIGNLSFLRFFYLKSNRFHGGIPQQISRLVRLQNLIFSRNMLTGELPKNLSHCLDLRNLYLNKNRLVGPILVELGSLKKLDTLNLASNNFTGFIPRYFGNLSSLKQIVMTENNVEGTIPNELGQLANLTKFAFGINNLSGTIPSSLYNISTITSFEITANQLTGTLPPNIGLALPNLEGFFFGDNNFHGEIPRSFPNASQLRILGLSSNRFSGHVFASLGLLQNLEKLNVGANFLGSNATNDLSFISSLSNCSKLRVLGLGRNNFGGEIPITIGNLSIQLQFLALGQNHLTGVIPSVLENLGKLYALGLNNNLFSGSIPSSLCKLVNFQVFNLNGNKFSGQIPSCLDNMTLLYNLNLADNMIEGNIPESIGNCEQLNNVDLSQNFLNGSIPVKVISGFYLHLNLSSNLLSGTVPVEVGKLKSVYLLDISNNKLIGNIPVTIGKCLSLEYLYVQGNFFQGIIPSALVALKGIRKLDISRNNLSGQIPKGMDKLPYLQHLNLSFNNLEGVVSKNGVFGNASRVSVNGNSKLCGGIKELQLPSCHITPKKPTVPLGWKLVIIAFGGVFVSSLTAIVVLLRRKARKSPTRADSIVKNLIRISYHELHQATGGFSSENLIGSGSFGSVYQGKLNNLEESLVAVKVLNLEKSGASKSFIAECRVLRNIRHRNLVKIITYCSSIDSKRNQFKALVYEFMANGSLDMWLQPHIQERSKTLSLIQRLNIAIDVVNAVYYLHNLCDPPIIHCDLKPSNILLDNELIAHVGDFGLARLLSKSFDTSAQGQTSSMGIKGSIGYTAPEYGMGGEASIHGDVYSYGVLLLELITGKRPTDDMFKDGLNLQKYVRTALEQNDVLSIVDPTLFEAGKTETGAAAAKEEREYGDDIVVEQHKRKMGWFISGRDKFEKCITAFVEVGVQCSVESPKERMGINDVVRELHYIRIAFLEDRIIKD